MRGECPQSPAALHRSPRRLLRPVDRAAADAPTPHAASEVAPPPAAAIFADAALRRVLEVIDRRRPIAQLRPMLTPPLLDMVFALTRTAGPDKAAMLRRENLKRSVDDLKVQLEDAKAALGEAFEEMKKAEMLDERDQMRERLEEVPVPAELAAVGSMGNRARA